MSKELSNLGKLTWPAGDEESRHSIVDGAPLMDEMGLGVSHGIQPQYRQDPGAARSVLTPQPASAIPAPIHSPIL